MLHVPRTIVSLALAFCLGAVTQAARDIALAAWLGTALCLWLLLVIASVGPLECWNCGAEDPGEDCWNCEVPQRGGHRG